MGEALSMSGKQTLLLVALAICSLQCGCVMLHPKQIVSDRNNLPPELSSSIEPQFERGEKRPIIDGIGWVFGIPGKIMLWNRKVENHNISRETEAIMAGYMAVNGLHEVKVRLNQYRPLDDWRRLTRNKSVAWPWRYTAGTLTVLGETLVPGRIFGGDHYNPFTGTIHLYSDLPSIALHEAGHAKDFARRPYPGTYAVLYALPIVPLYHESVATNDVLAYVEFQNNTELKKEVYCVLFPAYGTYVGNAFGWPFPDYAGPIYAGGIVAGHAVGRWRIRHAPNPDPSAPQAYLEYAVDPEGETIIEGSPIEEMQFGETPLNDFPMSNSSPNNMNANPIPLDGSSKPPSEYIYRPEYVPVYKP